MQAKATSGPGAISYRDLIKGAVMAGISAVLTTIYSAIDTGGLDSVNWKSVLTVTILAVTSYLLKNFFAPTKLVIENPPQSVVKAVKEGESKVTVTPK
jgi:hypothetical protein